MPLMTSINCYVINDWIDWMVPEDTPRDITFYFTLKKYKLIRKIVFIGSVILLTTATVFIFNRLVINNSSSERLFNNSHRLLVIAHRGGRALWPENTLFALERAYALGVDVLELDVRSTADGKIVVIHDETIDRTSNGSGKVNNYTLSELKKLDFAYNFIPFDSDKTILRGKGIKIPTLDEVFQQFHNCYFSIEIKDDSEELTKNVVHLIKQRNMYNQVLLASFYENVMQKLAQIAPDLAIAAKESEVRDLIMLSNLGLARLHQPVAQVYSVPLKKEKITIVTPEFINAAHTLEQHVYVWTINDSTEMKRLLRLGVDGIITDRPDLLLRILKRNEYFQGFITPSVQMKRCNNHSSMAAGIMPYCEKQMGDNSSKLKKIDKLTFLIHGFCYAELAINKSENVKDKKFQQYLQYEARCAEKWRSEIKYFSDNEALVIIPWRGKKDGPASKFNSYAISVLKDRCFILDCPDSFDTLFWYDDDTQFNRAILNELKSALVHQKDQWNDEELHTALHSLACCRKLINLLRERGYFFDNKYANAQGWGASFEGCVTKYTLNIRRILELANVIQINPVLTVPDAPFLLDVDFHENILLQNGLRLFIFNADDQAIGLFTMTSHSLANQATFVKLQFDQNQAIVKSKQSIRLWPQPEVYQIPYAAIGHYEPPQQLVKFESKSLIVPVSAGFVYRLAKAPAYIFAGSDINKKKFKQILMNGEIVNK